MNTNISGHRVTKMVDQTIEQLFETLETLIAGGDELDKEGELLAVQTVYTLSDEAREKLVKALDHVGQAWKLIGEARGI